MRRSSFSRWTDCALVVLMLTASGSGGQAQTGGKAQSPDQDNEVTQPVQEARPSDVPYGAPIKLESAKRATAAAEAEAGRHSWKMSCAVVEPAGDLVAFEKMDDASYGSIQSAEEKARSAARWRLSTKVFFHSVQSGNTYILASDRSRSRVDFRS